MKQVWQADDGSLFDTQQEAEEYEKQEKFNNEVVEKLLQLTSGISRYDIREVVMVLSYHYNVTPK